jgi:hypothetical protein
MSNYQHNHNAHMSLFSRFQNHWREGVTAGAAFDLAKASKLVKLKEEIALLETLTFESMQQSGLIVRNVTIDCRRGGGEISPSTSTNS